MARPKSKTPIARPHSSGQGRVTIDGRTFYLGKYGSPEAHVEFCRLITAWTNQTDEFAPAPEDDPITIMEITAGYWLFAERYYGFDKQPHRGDCHNVKTVIGIMLRLYGSLPAKHFGPLDLKALQAEMIRLKWARSYVNHSIGKVKRILKWAVSEEMIPPAVWHALLAVPGLKKGRTDAVERDPVKPVSQAIMTGRKSILGQHCRR